MNREGVLGPWPDMAAARLFLAGLVRPDPIVALAAWSEIDVSALSDWLIRQEIGTLARYWYKAQWAALGAALQRDMLLAVAESSLRLRLLHQLRDVLYSQTIPLVLLKGVSFALTIYPDPTLRTMSDIDLWVQTEDMATVVCLLEASGLQVYDKDDRPFHLQKLSYGEIRLYRQDGSPGLVELHWSAFSGWWLQRVACVAHQDVWDRKELLTHEQEGVYQLAATDVVIQVALHLAVNHQFGMKALQGLLDIALTVQNRGVDWDTVATRAREWRVATAVYTVLSLADQLIGLEGVAETLANLRPASWQCWLLRRFVSAESVLAGQDLRTNRSRYVLLLLLVDRPRDMLTLLFRTLWPETEWMRARYGTKSVSRWQHVWQVLRHGQI